MLKPLVAFLAVGLWALALEPARAQFQGGGTSGTTGTSGSSGSTTGTFGSRTLGSSQTAGARTGTGGSRAGGAGGVGLSSMNADTAGQITGSERFLRENRQAGQFVGADQTDIGNIMGSILGGQGGQGGRGAAGGGQLQRGGANQPQQQGRARRTVLPVRVEVGFSRTTRSADSVRATLSRRLARVAPGDAIAVEIQNRTVILRGEVPTAHDRDLAAELVRLEPGISSVQNDLVVAALAEPEASQEAPLESGSL